MRACGVACVCVGWHGVAYVACVACVGWCGVACVAWVGWCGMWRCVARGNTSVAMWVAVSAWRPASTVLLWGAQTCLLGFPSLRLVLAQRRGDRARDGM